MTITTALLPIWLTTKLRYRLRRNPHVLLSIATPNTRSPYSAEPHRGGENRAAVTTVTVKSTIQRQSHQMRRGPPREPHPSRSRIHIRMEMWSQQGPPSLSRQERESRLTASPRTTQQSIRKERQGTQGTSAVAARIGRGRGTCISSRRGARSQAIRAQGATPHRSQPHPRARGGASRPMRVRSATSSPAFRAAPPRQSRRPPGARRSNRPGARLATGRLIDRPCSGSK